MARQGDRLVVSVSVGEDAAASALMTSLQAQGVEVELRKERWSLTASSGMPHPPEILPNGVNTDLGSGLAAQGPGLAAEGPGLGAEGSAWWDVSSEDPLLVFDQYMGTTQAIAGDGISGSGASASVDGGSSGDITPPDSLSQSLPMSAPDQGLSSLRDDVTRAVIRVGRETITRLMHGGGGGGEGSDPTSTTAASSSAPSSSTKALSTSGQRSKISHLQFDSLSLANFGPYGTPMLHYPLSERGLVLIRGQVRRCRVG